MRFAPLPVLAWGTTFLAAGYLRLTNVFANIVGDEFVFDGPGAAYHAQRMITTWANYPHVPDFDPLLDWPLGGVAPWPQGFDLLVATIALPASDRFEALFLISLAPVLLGLVLIALVGWGTRLLAPDAPWWTAWLAATLVGLFPQSVSVTRFANPDHHVAEALIMLGLGLWSLAVSRALAEGSLSPGRRSGIEAVGTAVLVASLASHVATPAYVWIIGVSLAVANVRWGCGYPVRWAVGAPALTLSAIATACIYAPLIRAHGFWLDYAFPSLLQPLLVLLVAFACLGASLFGWSAGSRRRRVIALSAITVPLASAALTSGTRASVVGLLHGMHEWFADSGGLLDNVSENLPLFRFASPNELPWSRAHAYYGLFGPLLPILIPAGLFAHARRVGRWHALPFVAWTLGITLLTLQQNRFGRIGLVNLAMCSALVVAALAEHYPRWRHAIVAVPILMIVADPAFRFYARVEDPGPMPGMQEAGVFLRDHTPAPMIGNKSGVLTPWDHSFYVVRYGRRPVTATNFMPYVGREILPEVVRVWSANEDRLLRLAASRDLGYVALSAATYTIRMLHGRGPLMRGDDGGLHWNWEYFRGVPLAVLLLGGSGVSDAGVPQLEHLMPRFASSRAASGLPPVVPDSWVYQIVPGAVVRGRAPARTIVRLQTPLTRPGQRFLHEAWTRSGPDGAFTLTTPVPTGYAGAGFATGPNAVLLTGEGDPRVLAIPEHAVRNGETVSADAPR